MGWILAAVGLVQAVDFATFEYGLAASAGHGLPGGEYAGWVQLWIWVPFVTLIAVFLFLLFPDGHLPSPRWRLVGWLGGVFAVTTIAGLAFDPGSDRPDLPTLSNPFGVTPAALPFDAAVAGLAGLLCCVVLSAWSLFARSRRGTTVQRQQIKWLAYSGSLVALALVPASSLSLTPGIADRIAAGAVFIAGLALPAEGRRGPRLGPPGPDYGRAEGSGARPHLCVDERTRLKLASRRVADPTVPGWPGDYGWPRPVGRRGSHRRRRLRGREELRGLRFARRRVQPWLR